MTTEPKSEDVKCPECDGTGNDAGMKPVRLGEKLDHRPCTKCGGSGRVKRAVN